MSTSQIVIYGVLALLILFYLRRWWMTRSITRYSPAQARDRLKQGFKVADMTGGIAEWNFSQISGTRG